MTYSRLKSAENCNFQGVTDGPTNHPTDRPIDGWTDPLIELRGSIKKEGIPQLATDEAPASRRDAPEWTKELPNET